MLAGNGTIEIRESVMWWGEVEGEAEITARGTNDLKAKVYRHASAEKRPDSKYPNWNKTECW